MARILADRIPRPRPRRLCPPRRAVSDVRGLYFLGLSWQHTRGSALLGWVKEDAEFIAGQITAAAPAAAAAGDHIAHAEGVPEPVAASAMEGV
jgi:hypothetical protein